MALPTDFTFHTRNFTQALIKRKLEEQKENFRRRQGDEGPLHSQPPSTQAEALGQPPLAKVTSVSMESQLVWNFNLCNNYPSVQAMPQPTVANPSPLSFTPTSVMRKRVERKDSDPRIHVPELKVVACCSF